MSARAQRAAARNAPVDYAANPDAYKWPKTTRLESALQALAEANEEVSANAQAALRVAAVPRVQALAADISGNTFWERAACNKVLATDMAKHDDFDSARAYYDTALQLTQAKVREATVEQDRDLVSYLTGFEARLHNGQELRNKKEAAYGLMSLGDAWQEHKEAEAAEALLVLSQRNDAREGHNRAEAADALMLISRNG